MVYFRSFASKKKIIIISSAILQQETLHLTNALVLHRAQAVVTGVAATSATAATGATGTNALAAA